MKIVLPLLTTLVALGLSASEVSATLQKDRDLRGRSGRKKKASGSGEKRGGRKKGGKVQKLGLTLINEAFQQPFSPFFVMVHKARVPPLYVRGEEASPELARLAEDGNPAPLVDLYKDMHGVFDAFAFFGEDPPLFLGDRETIEVDVPRGYYVTIASMAINTNDCFCAINGMKLSPGQVLDLPGLDAGTEENNELCSSIPGPACPSDSGNSEDGNGEGAVHVHRGFFGLNEGEEDGLSQVGYDWRNPMLRVVVTELD